MGRALTSKEKKVLARFDALKPVSVDTDQVSLSAGGSMYSIREPALFKIPNSNSILIFGPIMESPSIEQMNKLMSEHLLKKMTEKQANDEMEQTEPVITEIENKTDEAILNEKDVELIMEHGNVSREKAIEALRESNMDAIAALVSLNKSE